MWSPPNVFHCPDVEATCADLQAKGVRISMPPKAMPWGIFAMIADLDGNDLGLTSQPLA
jgi:predicted enzyme related to lactoylglutathione lyase